MNKTFFAHRGASKLAPENTIPAFELAFQSGAQWIECDVMMSSDQALFIIHDDTLDRTTTGSGLVYETPAKILSELDAGSWFGASFKGTHIPRLEDLFDLMARYHTHANLELKATPDLSVNLKTAHLLAQALPALRKKAPQSKIVVSSFDHAALIAFSKESPETPVAVLMDTTEIKDTEATFQTLRQTLKQLKHVISLNMNDIHLEDHSKPLCAECIQRWKAIYPNLSVYTINNPTRAEWLFSQGIQGIFTDDTNLIQ